MINPEKPMEDIKNSDGLSVTQVMGRCAKCHLHGTINASTLPPAMIDAILAYRVVPKIYCVICKKQTEFIPTEVKKYKDVEMLKNMQSQVVNGVPPNAGSTSGLVDGDGNPLN